MTDRGARNLMAAQGRVDEWISQFEEGYWPPLANLAKWRSLDRVLSHHCRPRFPGLVFDPPPSVTDGGDPVAVELWEVTREVCLGGIARARDFGAAVEVGRFFAVMQALS